MTSGVSLTADGRRKTGLTAPGQSLRLTPHGHLVCEPADDAPAMDEAVAARLGEAFAQGSGHGLFRLGAGEVGQSLPPVFVWWRGFATRYVATLCLHGAGTTAAGPRPRAAS